MRNFPDGGDRRIVSTGGGTIPHWRPDSRELFYLAADGPIMSARVVDGRFQAPEVALSINDSDLAGTVLVNRVVGFAISPDGSSILLPARVDGESWPTMVLTQNWWSQFAERQ